ncbi:MAG: ATPase domain-containing protein [Nanoarchaeota archaeon]|nr:ATPase domain-containing protein [Nanoarchaeota archaeon]
MGKIEDFSKEVKGLKEFIALATVSAKEYQKTNIGLVKHFTTKENIPGVYVTLNKPYENMKILLEKSGVDTRKIIFIDAVSKTTGGKITKTKNCLYMGNPENLSDLSIAMDQAVRALPGKEKFLFFDSLSTLLVYSSIPTVAQFIHFLATKMRAWKVKGIIISLERKQDRDLIEELSQFCDVVIDFGGRK